MQQKDAEVQDTEMKRRERHGDSETQKSQRPSGETASDTVSQRNRQRQTGLGLAGERGGGWELGWLGF